MICKIIRNVFWGLGVGELGRAIVCLSYIREEHFPKQHLSMKNWQVSLWIGFQSYMEGLVSQTGGGSQEFFEAQQNDGRQSIVFTESLILLENALFDQTSKWQVTNQVEVCVGFPIKKLVERTYHFTKWKQREPNSRNLDPNFKQFCLVF